MEPTMTRLTILWILSALLLAACNAPLTPPPQPTATPTAVAVSTLPAAPTATPVSDTPVPATPEPVTEAQPTATGTAPQPAVETPSKWIAYLGADGNVWLVNPASGVMEPVTQDGTSPTAPSAPGAETVQYSQAKWSTDGLLAFMRTHGKPVESGYQFTTSLIVYDPNARRSWAVIEGRDLAGYAWRPGTREIAYGLSVDPNYFSSRGSVASELSKGIWTVQVDTGAVSELVKPERGFHLIVPQFTPDGGIVSFDEVYLMEGRGNFAYYDLAAQRYVSWDKPIGTYQWSSGGKFLFYDYLTYAPSGSERIYRNTRENDAETQISPADLPANTIAYGPALSPAEDQVAYIVEQMGEQGQMTAKVYVQPVDGGAPRDLGAFEQPGGLVWSPDGQSLLVTVGPYEARRLILISMVDGSTRELVRGMWPAWQP